MNINSYLFSDFRNNFPNTEIYKKIVSYYGNDLIVSYDPVYVGTFEHLTPRQILSKKIITAPSFYYLQFLLDIDPIEIVDIGCGDNTFKNFLPNVTGIDPYPFTGPGPDLIASFDSDFCRKNFEKYTCAFSIDALHFISLVELHQQILNFSSLIKKGGRGYISLNAARMIEQTGESDKEKLFGSSEKIKTEELSNYCDSIINTLPLKFLVVDNLINLCRNEFIDGNLRLVFEK